MSNRQYDITKFVALMAPVLTLIASVVGIWGVPYADKITATLAAIDTCLGAIVIIAKAKYKGETEDNEDE